VCIPTKAQKEGKIGTKRENKKDYTFDTDCDLSPPPQPGLGECPTTDKNQKSNEANIQP
jgi:hypothetical protein